MGKLTSLISGAGQGYLAGERYKDAKERNKTQDAMLKEVLIGRSGKESDPMDAYAGVARMLVVDGDPLSDDERKKINASPMANGGMVMPTHFDKMSWQRQSFKK